MKQVYVNLEFDKICDKAAEYCASELVAQKIRQTEPFGNINDARKALIQVGEALRILAARRPSLAFEDISQLTDRARIGALLTPSDFLVIKNCIVSLRSLKDCIENSDCDSLVRISSRARTCDELEFEIDRTVESETDLKDGASDKLRSLRRAIMRANAKLKERLDGLTRQSEMSKYLQDNIVTVRDGRFVVPVKSEYRSNVKGLIHDVSSTGNTVFVEPFAIVEANNELKTLKTEEQIEVERILAELGKLVAANSHELTNMLNVLAECGVIFAKAEYAKSLDAYCPILNDTGRIYLPSARHPLIDRRDVIPVDIALDKKILLISGPNTGGKTVALKTVGLFALMAASGMFLPTADGCEISVFGNIFCDIGDSQSIAQSLSTFSAHMTNIADITNNINENSLVLLDEVGDGTDPDEGAALAVAIIKRILRANATAVITTHFNAVKEFAVRCDEIANACMQFDDVNFKPTYKLLLGATGSSYALEIAEKLGLDKQIIADAKSALSEEKIAFDSVMREAEKLRNEAIRDKQASEAARAKAEENFKASEKQRSEYQTKLNDINAQARALIRRQAEEYSEKAERLIDEIKENIKAADESALFAARAIAKKLENGIPSDTKSPALSATPVTCESLCDGATVFVSGLNKQGCIVGKPRGNKVTVAIGSIKTEVPVSSLSLIEEKRKQYDTPRKKEKRDPVNAEIMLLGATVDEARDALDRMIDDIPSASTLRVVHGKGTGALGRGIQAYLNRHVRVKSYRYGGYGEGDSGVTIVEIK